MKARINCSELSEDQKSELSGQVENLVSELRSKANLDICTLNEVIIPDDFDTELVAFQESHDMTERGRTHDGSGLAVGKAVKYRESGQIVQTVFLDKAIWLGMLVSKEKSDHDMAIHLLHHELAHVQDGQYQQELFGTEFPRPYQNDLPALSRNLARNTWGEYYANRTSGGTMPLEHSCGISALYETLEYVFAEVDSQIGSYRFDGDIEVLWTKGIELCWRLMYVIGSSLGYFHYLTSFFADEGEVIKDTEKKAGESLGGLESVWIAAGVALDSLYNAYPNWTGVEDLDELSGVILKAFNAIGLYPRHEGEGVYVDVPFSTESQGGQE